MFEATNGDGGVIGAREKVVSRVWFTN
jgi:hypothetical protein